LSELRSGDCPATVRIVKPDEEDTPWGKRTFLSIRIFPQSDSSLSPMWSLTSGSTRSGKSPQDRRHPRAHRRFCNRDQNPYQPYTVDEIIKESIAGVEAGACSVHVHVRDEKGFPSGDRDQTEKVVTPFAGDSAGASTLTGKPLWKNFIEMMEPIVEDFYESAAVNCHAISWGHPFLPFPSVLQSHCGGSSSSWQETVACRLQSGDIDNTYRWLIKPGS